MQVEAQDYRTQVEQASLPDKVRKAALREVGELERTSDQSPESRDIRAWLDTILDLPWSSKTTDDRRPGITADRPGSADTGRIDPATEAEQADSSPGAHRMGSPQSAFGGPREF